MCNITISEFRRLSFDRKQHFILGGMTNACFIYHRKIGDDTTVFLYHVNNFFVEMFYGMKKGKTTMINCFIGPAELEQYIDTIHLNELKTVLK